MDSIKDLLNIKADNLDTSEADALTKLQAELDKAYQGKVKVNKFTETNVLYLDVGEGALASELRMSLGSIKSTSSKILDTTVKSVKIHIR